MRDAFTLGERDETVGGTVSPHPHDGGAQALSQANVLLKRVGVVGIDTTRVLGSHLST